jgi:Ca2+-transporting ATPase
MAEGLSAGAEFTKKHLAGLSDIEAASRIARYGFNELPSSKPRSIFRIAFEVVREPMLLLLVACGSIYLLLGDMQDAIILLIFVVVVIAITLYQERKTERALEALRNLSSPRSLVVRGGERKRIAGREVVPGDLLILAEGDRVPADGVLLSALNLSTDESLLTGESVPVRKQATPTDMEMAPPEETIFHASSPGRWLFEVQGWPSLRQRAVRRSLERSVNRCARSNRSPRFSSETLAVL